MSLHSSNYFVRPQMPSSKVKLQNEQNYERTHITQLTEQDLTISYSKYLYQIKFQEDQTTSFRKQTKSKKVSLPQPTFSSFANLSELFNDYSVESQESSDSQETANNNEIYEETVKIEDEYHKNLANGQSPIESAETSNSNKVTQAAKPSKLSLKTMRMREELQGFFESKNQKEIQEYVKRIDKQLKQLNANKNRLKYILRIRQGNAANQELIQTKLCPCCGKTITKLCFHCQHDKCQKSSCPRMKKQKLNAKMLVKLKEKKGGAGEIRRFKRSRDKDPKQQIARKGLNDESLSFSSDQYESEEVQSSEEHLIRQQKRQNMRLRNRELERKVPPIPNFEKTMTDIPLHESKLFVDSDSQ